MDLSFLPAVNASLNAVAATLLVLGRRRARRGEVVAHRRTMLAAFAVSSAFLALYVLHKASRGFENTSFHAEGAAKLAYLALLASHVVLAMAVPFLAVALVVLASRGRIAGHRRLARVAWPIWIYVSVTGVLIYLLLYPLNPAPAAAAAPRPSATGLAAPLGADSATRYSLAGFRSRRAEMQRGPHLRIGPGWATSRSGTRPPSVRPAGPETRNCVEAFG